MTMTISKRKPGWWYPWIFVGMFGVVVAVNGSLAYFAISSFTGLQTEGAYEKGLAYNKALAAIQAEERLGWTVEPQIDPSAITTGGPVTVTAKDRDGKPLDDLEVAIQLVRPTTAGYDSVHELVAQGAGRYQAFLKLPLPGLWDVKVLASRGADQVETMRRVVLK